MLRSLARNVARVRMRKKEIVQMNKKRKTGESYFSKNWRRYAYGGK